MEQQMPPFSAADELSVGRADAPEREQLLAATDLQDHLLVATNDLDRLHRLLGEAGDSLMHHFHGAADELRNIRLKLVGHAEVPSSDLDVALNHLASAITSLQFQDMASQLITHTGRRLRGCADRLAAQTLPSDDDSEAFVDLLPLSPNPVTQDEMDAGSVELF
jgi:hypothetical protein